MIFQHTARVTSIGGRPALVGRRTWVWNAARGLYQRTGMRGLGDLTPTCAASITQGGCTAAEVNTWCDTASALNPLSYLLCLPQDVQNVYSQVEYGTTFPAPPGAAAPGGPTAGQLTANLPGGSDTVGAAFTPAQSATEAASNSVTNWLSFFSSTAAGNTAAGAPVECSHAWSFLDSNCGIATPAWLWAVVAAIALILLIPRGKARR